VEKSRPPLSEKAIKKHTEKSIWGAIFKNLN
jgi:hypothetical protein